MRILFMGTPEFAVPCLQSLLDAGHEVAAVFTRQDKPKGRGYALSAPPVKVLAERRGIPVYQPATLRTPEAEETVRGLAPDAIVVVAYGRILPKEILGIPRFGCINVHASLLPKYRGAAPIQWAVINGETVTGVTTMRMDEGIDTGDILLTDRTEIGPDETAGELSDRLSKMGAGLIVKTLEAIRNGTAVRTPQSGEGCYASMLSREKSRVDWSRPSGEIHNLARGLLPWPAAWTVYGGKRLKVFGSAAAPGPGGEAGRVSERDGRFLVNCGEGTVLELLEVQPEGGRRMSGRDFLRGHPPVRETKMD